MEKPHKIWERGFSDQYRSENTLGHYAFGYNEDHTSGGSFRREIGDQYGNKRGSYGLRISDGRVRIVNYVADHNGYRADVISNEPGISSKKHSENLAFMKQSIHGISIPGMSYSAEAPHVIFRNPEPALELSSEVPTTRSNKFETTWDDSKPDRDTSEEKLLYVQSDAATEAMEAEHRVLPEMDYQESTNDQNSDSSNADVHNFIDDSAKLPIEDQVMETETESSLKSSSNLVPTDAITAV